MNRSLGQAAAGLLHCGRGAGSSLQILGVRGRTLGWQRLLGTPRCIGEEGQGGGLPQGDAGAAQCGFSNTVVQILQLHGIRDYLAYNMLDDRQLQQGIKDYSTIPQVYLNGDLTIQVPTLQMTACTASFSL
uniref:Glutaredoxin domain-containing protein n=1 Tax=Moschus moschiferus TaxID=68415 RepID=A0A8C6DG52_MOSMO